MSEVAEKWGHAVAQRGFAQIPNYLLLLNRFLDSESQLSPLELLVLIQLSGSWWRKGDLPFPSMRTLAIRCGSSERQTHRAVSKLESMGLIKKIKRRTKGIISSNAYDLEPLAEVMNEIAKLFPNEYPRNVDKSVIKEALDRVKDVA